MVHARFSRPDHQHLAVSEHCVDPSYESSTAKSSISAEKDYFSNPTLLKSLNLEYLPSRAVVPSRIPGLSVRGNLPDLGKNHYKVSGPCPFSSI